MNNEEISRYRKAFEGPASEAARGIVALLLPRCGDLDKSGKERVTALLQERTEKNRD